MKDSELGVKKKICLENCSKSTKTAIIVSKFSKNFRESMTLDPPRAIFLFLNLLPINSAEKKLRLKRCRQKI